MTISLSDETTGLRPVSTIVSELESEIESRERQLARLQADAIRIQAEIEQLRAARSAMHNAPRSEVSGSAEEQGSATGLSDAAVIRQFARRAILRAGRPLNRGELLRMMTDAGLSLSAKEPARRIGKVLWKSPDFISEADGYWLADRPLKVSSKVPKKSL